jgi:hypothetical protein
MRRNNEKEGRKMKTILILATLKTAKKQCPWASKIVKVDGGYMCFESLQDYETWRNQK